jgi:hypothetical protein
LIETSGRSFDSEHVMTGVFVTFQFASEFDEAAVRRIAATSQGRFQGMPGLRYKISTIDDQQRRATNVYVWDSDEAATTFFTPALLERVTSLYGVRPSIEYVQIAALVENT